MSNSKIFGLLLLLVLGLNACKKDDPTEREDNFNRTEMLENWADNFIIPGFEEYVEQLECLEVAAWGFRVNPSDQSLNLVRNHLGYAYKAWQAVSIYDIGKAEEINLRNFTNVYPTNSLGIEANVSSALYDLELPSSYDVQGLPAIDYLVNGLADTDAETIEKYTSTDSEPNPYSLYLIALSERAVNLGTAVLSDWKENYRSTFINQAGSDANASVNKLMNDYLYGFEKFLRAGKIGIPAGVFSSSPLENRVEAYYAKDLSKELFLEGLSAYQNFFNGNNNPSIKAYLDYLQEGSSTELLSNLISAGFDNVRTAANELDDNFVNQITVDNNKMLATYDRLQELVILLKVDMLQLLNIQVDYIDADGD